MTMRPHTLAAGVLAGTVTVWAAGLGIAVGLTGPDNGGDLRLVVFAPWVSDERSFTTMLAVGARPVGRARWPGVWVAAIEPGMAVELYDRGGAGILANIQFGPLLAGCSGN